MRLRTQLALTFLALTILPLGGLAAYSYYASSEAVRAALEDEAAQLAQEMDGKLVTARQWVARSVESVEPISLDSIVEEDWGGDSVARRIVRDMGSAAPLVRSFEYVPFDFESGSAELVMVTPEPPPVAPVPPAPRPPDSPTVPNVVIDIEQALREVESEREELQNVPMVGESLEFAFRALESIPVEAIVEQSMTAMEIGLRQANEELAASAAEREKEAQEEEIERKREAIARARETVRKHMQSLSMSDSHDEGAPPAPAIPVMKDGRVVGSVMADVHDEEIVREIFLRTAAEEDEIPFAIDSSGKLYSRSAGDEELIRTLGIPALVSESPESTRFVQEDWIIATSRDPESGLIIGVLRPAAEAISEVRKATLRSLGLGLALVGICLIGVMPLANHMTRDVTAVTAGAERIAHGELDTEVPVRSKNEVGRLAAAFNRMTTELRTNQMKLVEEEAARREQEVREQLLKKEYDRTASELEDARQFQLAMLPSTIPSSDEIEIAVEMTTATEVGGDYYDFHENDRGLTIAIGDGTGHGAKAGTMVAVIKSLFTALRSTGLATFLGEASATIRSMQLGRMSMSLTLMRIESGTMRVAAAGMPPLLLLRTDGSIEELGTPGVPLGTIDFPYQETQVDLQPGDIVVAMSDGLPELLDGAGEPFGYERTMDVIRKLDDTSPDAVIAALQTAAARWRGEAPQNDDMTLLVARYRGGAATRIRT